MISAFGRLVIKDGGFDAALGGELTRLFKMRNEADYTWLDAPARVGGADPVDAAERFVAAVERWLAER